MPKRKSFTFIALPHIVTNHPDFLSLSGNAVKLLIDIANQYNGFNNGDLCCAEKIMKTRGWKSKSALSKAIKDLKNNELIILTKQGGKNIPNLYAITWQAIDECKGKLDTLPTKNPFRSFKN